LKYRIEHDILKGYLIIISCREKKERVDVIK
jgi:hypothetical protein